MPLLVSLLLTAAATTTTPDMTIPEPDPSHMTLAEIRAHNKTVGAGHPYFIRCRRDIEIGSVAKMHTVCRTLRAWSHADDDGNRAARDTVRMLNETNGQTGG